MNEIDTNELGKFNLKPILWTGTLVVILMLLFSVYAWKNVPEGQKIPVHWGVDGQPDRYGTKLEGFFLMPAICLGLVGLFCGIPYIEPRQFNLAASRKAYTTIIVSCLLFMAVIHGVTILAAFGKKVEMNIIVPIGLGLLFLVIGNFMGKIRSNFFCGIRTPWTLSSELSWNKTHRLGGKLFMGLGLLLMFTPFFARDNFPVWLILGGVIGMIVIVFVYSYLVWKNDPNKQATGR